MQGYGASAPAWLLHAAPFAWAPRDQRRRHAHSGSGQHQQIQPPIRRIACLGRGGLGGRGPVSYTHLPERCLDILQAVGSPKLRATYDFSNFVQCGCDNMAAWQLLQDEVVYFHLKDSVYSGEHAQRDRGLEEMCIRDRYIYDGRWDAFRA